MKLRPLLTLLAATLPATAAAAPPALPHCRSIPDPEARLACYDRMETPAPPAPMPQERDAAPQEQQDTQEEETRNVTAPPAPEEAQETSSVEILRIRTTPTGRHRFELANGEVWEQLEARTSELQEGDKVDISAGLFGGWNLREHEGAGRSHRVRRVE